MARELPKDWTCEGQADLTDLVGTEHISGSVPADKEAADMARERFIQSLMATESRKEGDKGWAR